MGNKNDAEQKERTTSAASYDYGFPLIEEEGLKGFVIPKLCQPCIIRNARAKLIRSSTIKFGHECLRLVNIVVGTSKLFPSMMGTCDMMSEYLRKELERKHPRRSFHIIIAEKKGFDFSISGCSHFADIRQEQYRVLIYSTKPTEKTTMATQHANTQMKLQWKSVVIKQLDK